jgi:pyridoxamine 5'-phosphate oxidase
VTPSFSYAPAAPLVKSPVNLFLEWYASAHVANVLRHPEAMCVCTIGEDGLPQARFMDLKLVTDDGFVFCTQHRSEKGVALSHNPNVALTFWWDHIERQVRVVGPAQRISDADADFQFRQRPRDAQLASWATEQSKVFDDPLALKQRLKARHDEFTGGPIPRPPYWGGYLVVPQSFEFLSFRANRMHERLLFTRTGESWQSVWLEP